MGKKIYGILHERSYGPGTGRDRCIYHIRHEQADFHIQESLQMFLDGFGIFAPVIFTAIQIVQGGSAGSFRERSDAWEGCTHFGPFWGFCL